MRFKHFALLVASLLLTVFVFWNYLTNEWAEEEPFTAVAVLDDRTEVFTCRKDRWNDYYFFFPSYVNLANVRIYPCTQDEIWIGDRMLTSKGISCEQFVPNEGYGLARIGKISQYDGSICFVQSGNVPTMYIDVSSGNMEYIHQKKGNEESGTMHFCTIDGECSNSFSIESIKGRGNATWEAWKKSYSLTLTDQVDLMGMGRAQRWILLANAYDPTNLRNKIGYDLAKAAGMAYSPDSRWVDLYLNGEYAGVYLLCERNEVHPERVNIAPDNSFLISREKAERLVSQNYPYIHLKHGKAYRVHHSSFASQELEEIWMSMENALLSENGIDPRTGRHWTELIDLDSWVKRYLMDEITANSDGGNISQFYYYDGDSPSPKIYAGPVWDLDITFGWDWQTSSPQCYSPQRPIYPYGTEASAFEVLYQEEIFRSRVAEIYEDTFRPLLMELLDTGFDRYVQEVAAATNANYRRWATSDPEKRTAGLKEYLTERITFLDALLLRQEEFYDVRMVLEGNVEAWFAVLPGECLPEIPATGWYVCGSDEPFDVTQPIYKSVDIYQKQEPESQDPGEERESIPVFAALVVTLVVLMLLDKRKCPPK